MVKYFLLSLLTIIGTAATYLYIHLGASKPVTITIETEGPLYMVYLEHMGAYHDINWDIRKVEDWAQKQNLLCMRTFGEFLDDPQAVDQDRLRSHVGCLMSAKVPNPPAEFYYEERPEHRYVVGAFKGSPAIGPFKVYPKIKEYMDQERLSSQAPPIEVYTVNGSEVETKYLFAVD